MLRAMMGKIKNTVELTIRNDSQKCIRINYNGNLKQIPIGTVLDIKWVGLGYNIDDHLKSTNGIQPRRPESFNYLMFQPNGEPAVKLSFSGYAYEVCTTEFTIEKSGVLFCIVE